MNGSESLKINLFSIPSTNSWAKENREKLAPEKLTVVVAEEQTCGRGRDKRKWYSPNGGNIYASFCSFIPKTFPYQHNFAQLLSLSAANLLENKGFSPQLKWPNDVLIDGKKIGGILTELIPYDHALLVVNGIGLNINMNTQELLETGNPSTSLLIEGGEERNEKKILDELIDQYQSDLALFLEKGFDPFIQKYRDSLACQEGEGVSFHLRNQKIEGKFHSISPNGSINIDLGEKGVLNFT